MKKKYEKQPLGWWDRVLDLPSDAVSIRDGSEFREPSFNVGNQAFFFASEETQRVETKKRKLNSLTTRVRVDEIEKREKRVTHSDLIHKAISLADVSAKTRAAEGIVYIHTIHTFENIWNALPEQDKRALHNGHEIHLDVKNAYYRHFVQTLIGAQRQQEPQVPRTEPESRSMFYNFAIHAQSTSSAQAKEAVQSITLDKALSIAKNVGTNMGKAAAKAAEKYFETVHTIDYVWSLAKCRDTLLEGFSPVEQKIIKERCHKNYVMALLANQIEDPIQRAEYYATRNASRNVANGTRYKERYTEHYLWTKLRSQGQNKLLFREDERLHMKIKEAYCQCYIKILKKASEPKSVVNPNENHLPDRHLGKEYRFLSRALSLTESPKVSDDANIYFPRMR